MRRVTDLLQRLETYYDAAPRPTARTEEIGPFTLFVATGASAYYARPRLGYGGPFTPADVTAVRERQQELGVPVAFEWVHENSLQLAEITAEAGLEVHSYPLLVLAEPLKPTTPEGVKLRLLTSGDKAVAAANAVLSVGFGAPGTAEGPQGPEERDARVAEGEDDDRTAYVNDLLERDLYVFAVAEDATGPVAGGLHLPRGDVTEVAGIATLPTHRRRGIGAAVTALLVDDAKRRGIDVVFLSAGSEDIARVYERAGFRRFATAGIASA
jgi:GNAT superfamily N-acetyltransferase